MCPLKTSALDYHCLMFAVFLRHGAQRHVDADLYVHFFLLLENECDAMGVRSSRVANAYLLQVSPI